MPRPSTFPTLDTNGTRTTAPLSANQTDGFTENQQVANSIWNWLFHWIHAWIVYLDDIATTQFGVEHDVTSGVHTDVNADSLKAHAIYVEDDVFGSTARVGAIIESAARSTISTTGNAIADTVPANTMTNKGVVRMQGSVEHSAESTGPSVIGVEISVAGAVIQSTGITTPSVNDWIAWEAEFAYDSGTGNMQYHIRFRSNASLTTADEFVGEFAFTASSDAIFAAAVAYTGGTGLTAVARAMTIELHLRG